jgi:reactive intermediate/imine deaminase
MVKRTNLEPVDVAKPVGPYALGVKVTSGTLVFVSGCVALDTNGQIVGKGDVAAQTRKVMENMKAVLASAGATFNDVVKINNYVVDASQYPKIAPIRNQYLTPPYPASTLIEVKSLLYPEFLVEIEAIAVVDGTKRRRKPAARGRRGPSRR